MKQRHREMIGRATMLVAAIVLLLASVKVGHVSWHVVLDEKDQRAQRSSPSQRTSGYGACFVVGTAGMGFAGLYLLKLALLSHRNLDKHPPRPPVLWENPEAGPMDHWTP